jgi:hypothetical protein
LRIAIIGFAFAGSCAIAARRVGAVTVMVLSIGLRPVVNAEPLLNIFYTL